jgi:hypothetical protein
MDAGFIIKLTTELSPVIEPLMPVAKEAGRKKQRRFLILLGLKI